MAQEKSLITEQVKILNALNGMDSPAGNKQIAEVTGLDAKVVSTNVAVLKKKGYVDSPVRCKYCITSEGKANI